MSATSQEIGDSLIADGWRAVPDPDDPASIIFVPPPNERFGDNR